MMKLKSEEGSITVFVIVAFIFCMAILINLYWTSTNAQVTVLQAEQRLKEIYGEDVNNIDQIYEDISDPTIVI